MGPRFRKVTTRHRLARLNRLADQHGYSLIELVVVLVIIGVIAAIAVRSLSSVNDTVRTEATKQRLNRLARAITGDPSLVSGGVRTDYGFVGDMGRLPGNLRELAENTGGWSTWHGPYLNDDITRSGSDDIYDKDGWGHDILLSGTNLIASGGPVNLARPIAQSTSALLRNRVSMVVTDLDYTPPGSAHRDSITLLLSYPNGSGGTVTLMANPSDNGFVSFDSIPVGIHTLRMVYEPDDDTLTRRINVDPGRDSYTELQYYADVWNVDTTGGGGTGAVPTSLTLVTGSVAAGSWLQCNRMSFKFTNQGSSTTSVGSLTLTWSTPTAFYQTVRWNGSTVFSSSSPRAASGSEIVFGSPRTIAPGDTVTIEYRDFISTVSGGGSSVGMDNTTLSISFSEGSSFVLTTGGCL